MLMKKILVALLLAVLPALVLAQDPATSPDLSWDFVAVENWNNGGAHLDAEGWSIDTNTVAFVFKPSPQPEANHPGVVQVKLKTAGTGILGISQPQTGGRFGDIVDASFIVKFESRNVDVAVVGLAASPAVGSDTQPQITFRSVGGTAEWEAVAADGTSYTRTGTGVSSSNGAWVNFRVARSGSDWLYYIDGSLVATHTTSDNLPADTAFAQPGVLDSVILYNDQRVNLDFARLRLNTNRASGGSSGGGGGAAGVFAQATGCSGSVPSSPGVVSFSTLDFNVGGGLSFSYSAGEFTITGAGTLEASAQVTGTASGRTELNAFIQKNGVDVLQGSNYSTRNSSQNQGSAHVGPVLVSVADGDVLRVRANRQGSSMTYDPDGCAFVLRVVD